MMINLIYQKLSRWWAESTVTYPTYSIAVIPDGVPLF